MESEAGRTSGWGGEDGLRRGRGLEGRVTAGGDLKPVFRKPSLFVSSGCSSGGLAAKELREQPQRAPPVFF